VKAFFPHVSGLYDFQHGSFLYVSRGSGTWGPPMRFLSPPEVTIIDIVRDEPISARKRGKNAGGDDASLETSVMKKQSGCGAVEARTAGGYSIRVYNTS